MVLFVIQKYIILRLHQLCKHGNIHNLACISDTHCWYNCFANEVSSKNYIQHDILANMQEFIVYIRTNIYTKLAEVNHWYSTMVINWFYIVFLIIINNILMTLLVITFYDFFLVYLMINPSFISNMKCYIIYKRFWI